MAEPLSQPDNSVDFYELQKMHLIDSPNKISKKHYKDTVMYSFLKKYNRSFFYQNEMLFSLDLWESFSYRKYENKIDKTWAMG